ncbi:hypothetical protein ACU8KH_04091 [Lachancea thermotolerans]
MYYHWFGQLLSYYSAGLAKILNYEHPKYSLGLNGHIAEPLRSYMRTYVITTI